MRVSVYYPHSISNGMRFEVPQFIEVEDKIIGPFTWKQFIYLAGGLGLLIIFYFALPFVFFAMFGLPVGGLAGFLAFHRVNNRPFSVFLESFVNYMTKNKLYLWKKEHEQTIVVKKILPPAAPDSIIHTQRKGLASLSRKLELDTLQK